jgi:hypothetical protein
MRTKRTTIISIINSASNSAQAKIDRFLGEIDNGSTKALGLNYALHWHGEDALQASRFIIEFLPFVNLASNPEFSLEDMTSLCKGTKKIVLNDFKNGCFRMNSTNPMSNLESIALGQVQGKILKIVETIERELNEGE